MAKHAGTKGREGYYGGTGPQRTRGRQIAAGVAGAGWLVFVVAAYVWLPNELPAIWQRLLGLACAGLAAGVYGLATRRPQTLEEELLRRLRYGQATDFGKEVRAARPPRHAIRLPLVGETSKRLLGGIGVFILVGAWWLTPLAPVVVQQRKIADLTVVLGEEIVGATLVWPGWPMAVVQPPMIPSRARDAARLIREDDPLLQRALKATVEGDVERAKALLAEAVQNKDVGPGQVELARAQQAMFDLRFGEAVQDYGELLKQRPGDPMLLCQAAAALMHTAEFAKAEPLVGRALKAAQDKASEQRAMGMCLHLQAILCAAHGRQFDDAENLSYQARESLSKALGEQHPLIAASLNNQASYYLLRGKYSSASELFQAACELWGKASDADDTSVAAGLSNLAVMECYRDRFSSSHGTLQRAAEIQQGRLPEEHPARGMTLAISAMIDEAMAEYQAGVASAERALVIVEKNLGSQHPSLAAILDTLATLYQDGARYVKADVYYVRAEAIARQAWGPKHPCLAAILDHHAALCVLQGRYAEADSFSNQSMELLKQAFGEKHPNLAAALVTRARLEIARGNASAARRHVDPAMKIQQGLGKEHLGLARALAAQAALENLSGAYPMAVMHYKQALGMTESLLGAEHPDVARILVGMAAVYRQQDKIAEAEQSVERALAIQEKKLPPFHPELAATLEAHAAVLLAAKPSRSDQAASLQSRARDIRAKHTEVDQPE